MPSAWHEGSRYHFLSLWYDSGGVRTRDREVDALSTTGHHAGLTLWLNWKNYGWFYFVYTRCNSQAVLSDLRLASTSVSFSKAITWPKYKYIGDVIQVSRLVYKKNMSDYWINITENQSVLELTVFGNNWNNTALIRNNHLFYSDNVEKSNITITPRPTTLSQWVGCSEGSFALVRWLATSPLSLIIISLLFVKSSYPRRGLLLGWRSFFYFCRLYPWVNIHLRKRAETVKEKKYAIILDLKNIKRSVICIYEKLKVIHCEKLTMWFCIFLLYFDHFIWPKSILQSQNTVNNL